MIGKKIFILLILPALLTACNKVSVPDSVLAGQREATNKTDQSDTQNSIYQLPGTWTNQNGQPVQLEQLSGKVQVVAMIFTTCGYACPKIVDNLKEIESKLPAGVKKNTHFLLISFDSKTDSAARLKQYAVQKNLGSGWTLLHGNSEQVRVMSMLLQVQYSPLQGGGFNHSNVITILDEHGNIYKRIEGLDISVNNAVKEIKEAESNI